MKYSGSSSVRTAIAHFQSGDLALARHLCEQVLSVEHDHPDALNVLGSIALEEHQTRQAIVLYQRLVGLLPGNSNTYYNLGIALFQSGRATEAVEAFENAVRLKPDFAEGYCDLASALLEAGRLSEARGAGEMAVRLAPERAGAYNNLGAACDALGDSLAALDHFERAAALEPTNALFQKNLGNLYLTLDNRTAAEACYRAAIRARPDFGEAHQRLATVRPCNSPRSARFAELQNILAREDLAREDRGYIHFALARMFQDCGVVERAFENWSAGNRIRGQQVEVDPDAHVQYISALIDTCDAGFVRRLRGLGDPSVAPVFVVGLPFSGTELAGNILGIHRDAHGAGELPWMTSAVQSLPGVLQGAGAYPGCLAQLDGSAMTRLAAPYLRYLFELSGGQSERVIDRNANNFLHLGLIAMLFPNAHIVHCRRDPLDNAMAIFSNALPSAISYGHDLATLQIWQQQYQRLMGHWCSLLPGRITDIEYESLVANPEKTIRRLVEAVGLEWDGACLGWYQHKTGIGGGTGIPSRPTDAMQVGFAERYRRCLAGG